MTHTPENFSHTDAQYGIYHIIKGTKPYVEVPEDIFERMIEKIEDLEDIEAVRAARENPGEYFPSAIVEAILRDENPIKIFREYRGITQSQLAKKAAISRSYLASLETGKKAGSPKVLKAIAKSLNLDLDDLV